MQGWSVGLGSSGWASRVRLALFPLALVPFLAGCGEEHLVQWRERVVDSEGEQTIGASCAILGEGEQVGTGGGVAGGGNGAPSRPGYQLQWDGLTDGVRLSVFDVYGELVEEREFDETFLESGQRAEVTPALDGGGLVLIVWGGEECDEIDSSDFE